MTPSRHTLAAGILFLLCTMLSIQFGSALAKILMGHVGPQAGVVLRLLTGTIILFAVLRPWRQLPSRQEWKQLLSYGLSIAAMNVCFYEAIFRMHLGIVVSIELTGPLLVAACTSRSRRDLVCVFLAGTGVVFLLPFTETAGVTWSGAFWAAMAALSWIGYIIFGVKAGTDMGQRAVSWGLLTATIATSPLLYGESAALAQLCTPSLFGLAFLVGLTASALPFWLELNALRLLPKNLYGVLISLEPLFAMGAGMLFLNEWITLQQGIAMAAILSASVLMSLGHFSR